VAEDAAWYCWHASATASSFLRAWEAAGIRYHQTITWVKPTFVLGFAMWNYRTEPCLMGWQQGHKPEALPVPAEHSNCWEVDWEGKSRCTDGTAPHPEADSSLRTADAQTHPARRHLPRDVRRQSGSQVIAAERLGRRCFAVERMPAFCDVIVRRWEAVHGADGRQDRPRRLGVRGRHGYGPDTRCGPRRCGSSAI
jgi:hypothetical protein